MPKKKPREGGRWAWTGNVGLRGRDEAGLAGYDLSEAAFARPSISIGRSKLEEFHGHRCKMGCHYVPLLHSSVWHMLKVWNQKTDTN